MAVPPAISSTIAVPLSSDLGVLQRLLEQEIPRDLWTIDQPDATCAGPQKVKLFGAQIGVTPKLKCHIVGVARRGAIALHGQGQVIVADLPITADVRAENVGGLVNAHATGKAMAHARISLSLTPDWRARGTIALAYDWSTPPGIDLLGQRVTFTDKADEKLKPLIAKLQAKLPAQLDKLNLRAQVQGLWAKGFAVLNLNQDNPPVWMRIVPQQIEYGGYTIAGNRLTLKLGMVALTQAVVGNRPENPAPTPLPPMGKPSAQEQQVKIFAPVIADYAQLVPVLDKALAKRSAKPFVLPGIGPVTARFSNIDVFGATHGRIAVGADVTAFAGSGTAGSTHGRIWFAARPDNADGSQLVHFSDLSVSGGTDNAGETCCSPSPTRPAFPARWPRHCSRTSPTITTSCSPRSSAPSMSASKAISASRHGWMRRRTGAWCPMPTGSICRYGCGGRRAFLTFRGNEGGLRRARAIALCNPFIVCVGASGSTKEQRRCAAGRNGCLRRFKWRWWRGGALGSGATTVSSGDVLGARGVTPRIFLLNPFKQPAHASN
jgi:hypothetical protein